MKLDFVRRFSDGKSVSVSVTADLEAAPVQILFGPSGSGKSTALRCLAGLEQPVSGFISFRGETWLDSDRRIHLRPQQRRMGYLAQDPALFPHLNVRENIAYGSRHAPDPRASRGRLDKLIEVLELSSLLDRRPERLSGGQKQKVALARALAASPRLLLLDEPFSALDFPTRDSLRVHLRMLLRELRLPAVVVTHDRTEAYALGHEVHILDQGQVLESGPLPEGLLRPKGLQAARISGVENFLTLDGQHFGLRAEEIRLELSEVPATNAGDLLLDGRIQCVLDEGPMTRVKIDGAHPLTALVPREPTAQGNLRSGRTVRARIPLRALWKVEHDTFLSSLRMTSQKGDSCSKTVESSLYPP